MNTTRQVIAALFFAVAGSAAIAGTSGDITTADDTFVTTKTRAEVQAEVLQARAAGVTHFVTESNTGVDIAAPVPSSVTREQVRAELRSAPRVRTLIYNPAA